MNAFEVGDKVKIIHSGYLTVQAGDEGVVVETREDRNPPRYTVASININGNKMELGFTENDLELIEAAEDEPEPETNEDLEWLLATARDAQWIFEHYAKLHSEKGTADGIYKSMFNLMIADRLADAVEANS